MLVQRQGFNWFGGHGNLKGPLVEREDGTEPADGVERVRELKRVDKFGGRNSDSDC